MILRTRVRDPGPIYFASLVISSSLRSYNRGPRRPCPRYFLSGGLTSGCVLPARRLRSLEIDVRRGAESVFYRKGLASAFRE